MPLEIAARQQEEIEILDLKGRLTFGEEDLHLREELENLLGEKKTKVVMNLGDLHQIDTTGFGTLLFAQETLGAAGGGLALAGFRAAHHAGLMKAKLEAVFEIFEDDQSALNSFIPGRVSARY